MRIWITALADLAARKGSARHLRELLAGLRARGHDALLFVSRESPLAPEPGIVPVPMPRLPVRGLRYASGLLFFQILLAVKLLGRLRHGRPDILYARHDAFLVIPTLLARAFDIPLVSEINGVLAFELHLRGHGRLGITASDRIERWVYRRSRRVIAVAPTMAEHLVRNLGVPDDKVVVNPNGADLALFSPGDGRPVRARLGVAEDEVLVGYVGGLQPYQGVSRFLEHVRPLLLSGPPVRVLIVGGGGEETQLRRMASTPPFAGRLMLTGAVPYEEVPGYIHAMDVCVLPKLGRVPGSPHEYSASPLKAFEYMACGKPILANDLADFRFLAEAGAALLADVESGESFRRALAELVAQPDLRARLGEAGLRYARESGSWGASIARVEAVLREVTGR